MGTRALVICSARGVERNVLYVHSDGYPEGLGVRLLDLAEEWANHAGDMEPGEASDALEFCLWLCERLDRNAKRDVFHAGKRGMDAEWCYWINLTDKDIDVKYSRGDGSGRYVPKADLDRDLIP